MANKSSTKQSQSHVPLFISGIIIVGIVLSYFLIPSVQQFINEAWQVLSSQDEQRIEQWVSKFGWFGPIIIILAMVIQMFLIVIPSIVLMVVAILAYGPIWGSLIVLAAVYVASSVGYLLGRYLSDSFITKLLGQKTENKISDFIEDYGFWAVAITRLNPFLSNDAISFVAGVLKMGYWKFITATLVGIAPLTLFIAILGKSNESLKNGLLYGSIISLVIFGLYIYWDKKLRKKNT